MSNKGNSIKIVGIGGAGCNTINAIMKTELQNVEFIAIGTDNESLNNSKANSNILIGQKTIKGQGSSLNPKKAYEAAKKDRNIIKKYLENTDVVFIIAGMGGGTGSGAAPVITQIARELKIFTIGFAIMPFSFEGKHRRIIAETGSNNLKNVTDTLFIISNDKLLEISDENTTIQESFKIMDNVLINIVRTINDLIIPSGITNCDFKDIREFLENSGLAFIGFGTGIGKDRILKAAQNAISFKLSEHNIQDAKKLLINIRGPKNLTVYETTCASKYIISQVDMDVKIIFGVSYDKNLKDEVKVTVIASEFNENEQKSIKFKIYN